MSRTIANMQRQVLKRSRETWRRNAAALTRGERAALTRLAAAGEPLPVATAPAPGAPAIRWQIARQLYRKGLLLFVAGDDGFCVIPTQRGARVAQAIGAAALAPA